MTKTTCDRCGKPARDTTKMAGYPIPKGDHYDLCDSCVKEFIDLLYDFMVAKGAEPSSILVGATNAT